MHSRPGPQRGTPGLGKLTQVGADVYEVAQALHIQGVGCMDAAVLCQSLQAPGLSWQAAEYRNVLCQGLLAQRQLLRHGGAAAAADVWVASA